MIMFLLTDVNGDQDVTFVSLDVPMVPAITQLRLQRPEIVSAEIMEVLL